MLYFYLWIFVHVVLESLPVSSSGHLVLLESILNRLGYHIPDLELAFCSFTGQNLCIDIVFHLLHGPTMIIVALFFFKEWFFLLRNIKQCYHIIFKIIFLTGIADIVTAFFFIAFKLYPIYLPLGFGFFITGILLYSLRWCTNKNAHFDWKKACILGCIQGCALLPGISRFASVYVGARWLGLPIRRAFQVTWLVQWPLIFAAFIHGMYILTSHHMLEIILNLNILITVVIASICAYILLLFVNNCAQHNRLWWFSFYMSVPMLLWIIFSI